ncbi:formimidoylglutamase [Adhaeribacter pallidiroseus]|uniref:Formimidoylglutamase n=1 Tax=Adhaeribacter pallidiroseus TaxID=2072847 RepID=A0A369QSL5_9BACT|nr:formimidoylglutamase [Adhaeribacter pallidiroseus]RDC66326.1 Formimidoylglutamase [Adhaeribacter pallidiroseus]
MNLAIFFEPLPEEFYQPHSNPKTFGASIDLFIHKFPEWRQADIALLGINEIRGTGQENNPENRPATAVRRQLYALKKGTGRYKIVDLGDLLPGITLEDTYLRIKEIVENLISQNTLPIIIGGSHDLDYGQFLAYENLDKAINLVTIDSHMDMSEEPGTLPYRQHLQRILLHEPNYLFSLSQIAYQSYFVEQEVAVVLEKLHFETVRLGQVHTNIQEVEPVVRHADMISFDIRALKHNDAPGYEPANPFGLTGEEACQLCWYAGLNDTLSSFGIYDYSPALDVRQVTAATIAVMLWYFVEGYYHRKNETDFTSNKFLKYAIGFHDNPNKMVFYKSKVSDKWWMEVEPLRSEKQAKIIPCSYEDYLLAAKGEIPNRWILTQSRLA